MHEKSTQQKSRANTAEGEGSKRKQKRRLQEEAARKDGDERYYEREAKDKAKE